MSERLTYFDELLEQYPIEEKLHFHQSTFQVRKAFQPITHLMEGDPTKIISIKELCFFSDTMHESSLPDSLIRLKELSQDEIRILSNILVSIWNNSENFYTRCISINSILRHLLQYRYFKEHLPSVSSVLEIGPGSGYLPLLIAKLSPHVSVLAMDVTQSLYLYQSWLYEQFGVLMETVGAETSEILTSLKSGRVLHLPWWNYLKLSKFDLKIDSLIINHAVCEIHPYALDKILTFSNQSRTKYLLIEGLGLQRYFSSHASIIRKMSEFGYSEFKILGPQCYLFTNEISHFKTDYTSTLTGEGTRQRMRNVPFAQPLYRELKKLRYFLPSSSRDSKSTSVFLHDITAFQQMNQIISEATGQDLRQHFREKYDHIFGFNGKVLDTHLNQEFELY
jgi:hypothetical protein